jgi:replicative DNA helicase Mcm
MEQQSISLTKAGIHATIPAKPSILAAANPKFSTWDVELDILKNINFESFLLTRFDLIIGLITEDPVNDGFVYDHIINGATGEQKTPVDKSLLIKYINLCRTKKPILTKEAGRKISDFFKNIKNEIQINNDSYVPIETRQLEGMVRLSTAHAKLLLKDEVETSDVDVIIGLFKYSLDSLHIGYEGSLYQADLNDKKKTKEQAFLIILKEMRDENGLLNETRVINRMARDKRFGEIEKARKYFDFAVKRQMIHLSRDGASFVEPTPLSPH